MSKEWSCAHDIAATLRYNLAIFRLKENSQRETKCCHFVITGLPMANPVEVCVDFVVFLFFSVSVKVLPVTPLLSGGFVHRAFCAYFLRNERVVGNA